MSVRQYVINGECMVYVRGQGAVLDLINDFEEPLADNIRFVELGLTSEQVIVSIIAHHQDVLVDDYGPKVPAEVLVQGAEVQISMDLIHYDALLLQSCLSNSLGGSYDEMDFPNRILRMPRPERMFSAGVPLGRGRPSLYVQNMYIQLLLTSQALKAPWLFPTTYILNEIKIPVGTNTSISKLTWRSIPYKPIYRRLGDPLSSGFSNAVIQEINMSGTLIFDAYNQYLLFNGTSGAPTNINYTQFSGGATV